MGLVKVIRREQLENMLAEEAPDNEDREDGYALVNVGGDRFGAEHIPYSINIPATRLGEFERRFAKSKPIVVYCSSPQGETSRRTAQALVELGFESVFDYAAGLSDWRQAGNPVEPAL